MAPEIALKLLIAAFKIYCKLKIQGILKNLLVVKLWFYGDFQQVLPIVKKERREDVVQFAIYQSHLWNYCHVFKLHQNMRLMQNNMSEMQESFVQDFSEWILKIINGDLVEGDGDNNITVPHDLII